jgi:uncharacterized protein
VEFEFDPNKSRANKKKHGIDFDEAQALWTSGKFVEAAGKFVEPETEPRFFRIAMINGILWFSVFTMRGDKVRLISVRRTRPEEKELYEQQD